MKTVILAGLDNLVFTAADLLNPKELKLIGYASAIREAWNIYDENGKVKENMDEMTEMPVMPLEAAAGCEPDLILLVSSDAEDDQTLKYMIYRADFRGEVISMFDFFGNFSPKTAVLRKLAWRLKALGVEGAAADLGAYRGDISWQMNALMPERKLYLFDTFTGYDSRDVEKEQELKLSDVKEGEYSLTRKEYEHLEDLILGRMPYRDQVVIRKGWFPQTAFDLEEERYALVHMDTGLYNPTCSGIQYFFPRMSQDGVIILSGYEDGKKSGVRMAVEDLEARYGAFLITPIGDLEGTVVITHP